MEMFPRLAEEQVAVIRADGKTGHLLTIGNSVITKPEDAQVYTVFENVEAAWKYIHQEEQVQIEIDFSIFDRQGELVAYIPAQKWRDK